MKLLAEIREAVIERILRKRLQERYDKGFLAGIDTAREAILRRYPQARTIRITPLDAVDEAREGFLEEVRSR
jgi:hypothetical protein